MKKYYINNKGFTLIELLVVVMIIGVLATIVTVAVAGGAIKSRDARRKADLDVMKKAVGLYSIDNGSYPVGNTPLYQDGYAFCTTYNNKYSTNWNDIESITAKYLENGSLPRDPKQSCPATSDTNDGKGTYTYITNVVNGSSVATKFSIWTFLENKKDTDNNSSGKSGTMTINNESNGTDVLSSATGKYKNTYFYAKRASYVGLSTNLEAIYGVGTAK